MLMIYLQCLLTSICFLFRYKFVAKSIFWHSNVSMSLDLLTWKIFSFPNNLNETSDQLLKGLLEEYSFKLETYGRCACFVVAPSFWNDLPVNLRFEDDLTCFKFSLKTHLFTLFTNNPDSYVYWYVIFDLYMWRHWTMFYLCKVFYQFYFRRFEYIVWKMRLINKLILLSLIVNSPLGEKVSMLTHVYPHKARRKIKVIICKIIRLTAHFMCGLMSDLVICTCL